MSIRKTTELDEILYNVIGKPPVYQNTGQQRNINPTLWGPPAWEFIDYIVMHYPESPTIQDKTRMVNFVTSLGNVLPCEKCRASYTAFMKAYPPLHNVSSRSALGQWFSTYKGSHGSL